MKPSFDSPILFLICLFILWVFSMLCFSGCVSIQTHERMLRETRDREVEYAQKLAVELEHGEISIRDMEWLLHGRCE